MCVTLIVIWPVKQNDIIKLQYVLVSTSDIFCMYVCLFRLMEVAVLNCDEKKDLCCILK